MTAFISNYFIPQQLTSCHVATIEGSNFNLNATYFNGPTNSGVGATLTNAGALAALQIDTISIQVNDRILVNSQTNTFENGIYECIEPGSSAVRWVLRRTADFQSAEQMKAGYFLTVEDGFVNAGSIYTLVAPAPSIVGVSGIHFRSADQDSIAESNVIARTVSVPGGSATFTVTATGATATSVAVANFDASTNAVSIQKVTPGTNDITILCSGDPGASFLSFILFKESI